MIQYPKDSEPHIQWTHVDGPLLICRDGSPHWITILERLFVKAGITTIKQLDEKYHHNGEPQKG